MSDELDLFPALATPKLRRSQSEREAILADLADWRSKRWVWRHTERPSVLLSDAHKLIAAGDVAGAIEYRAAYYRWRNTGTCAESAS